ncbi:hypothetical protein [Streptomyces platensis]|uniref:hypothetical protein n=1 Tax=Streptomyces platensis TaxID=58346 RepID=UPI001AD76A69|nr:hypothetical protein [Streptomyces platensis]
MRLSPREMVCGCRPLIAGKSIVQDAGKAAARARTLRESTVEIWPEASHAINGEYPARLAERVHAFLDGVHEHRQG